MSPLLSWELFIAIGIFIAIPMTRLYRQSRDGEDWSDTPDSVGAPIRKSVRSLYVILLRSPE
jgi:hypothetical protein